MAKNDQDMQQIAELTAVKALGPVYERMRTDFDRLMVRIEAVSAKQNETALRQAETLKDVERLSDSVSRIDTIEKQLVNVPELISKQHTACSLERDKSVKRTIAWLTVVLTAVAVGVPVFMRFYG